MQLPLQITFRHMESSDAVTARIRERAGELERFFDRIISCRVVVECRHPRRQQGNLFRVRIDLKVPGREITVGRDPAAHKAHEDIYVPEHGRIARLRREQNGGFILSADGNEIYFHRNSVANSGFDKLAVGDEVRFVAQHSESAAGPQASTVVPLGKHHLPPAEMVRA